MSTPVAAAVMTVMHEEVHQRAGKEQKIWQGAEEVRPVLGEEEERRDGEEAERHDAGTRPPPWRLPLRFVRHGRLLVQLHRHVTSSHKRRPACRVPE